MRHQIRLLDQNLPGLARELALSCGRAVDPQSGAGLYRALYRSIRDLLRARVSAFRYCGSTSGCEHALRPKEGVVAFRHEAYPGERVHVYLLGPDCPPASFIRELGVAALAGLVRGLRGWSLRGAGPKLRERIEETLKGRLFTATTCGELPICGMNEPYDPWDLRDPSNRVKARAV